MPTVRVIITLKPGILDAPGQAVLQGLRALGYADTEAVRVGRYIELTVPDAVTAVAVNEMCDRFLANPLIEEWRIETDGVRGPGSGVRSADSRSRDPAIPRSREAG